MVRRQELLIAIKIGIKFHVEDYDDRIRQTQIISSELGRNLRLKTRLISNKVTRRYVACCYDLAQLLNP